MELRAFLCETSGVGVELGGTRKKRTLNYKIDRR